MKTLKTKQKAERLEIDIVSLEDLIEVEYNMEYNPFDTNCTGYHEDDITDEIRENYKKACNYHKLMEKYWFKLLK